MVAELRDTQENLGKTERSVYQDVGTAYIHVFGRHASRKTVDNIEFYHGQLAGTVI